MFNIPVKEVIVNDDAQVRLLEDDGTVYLAADATPSAGGFILEGFLSLIRGSELQLLKAATRIIKTVPVAGVAEIKAYTVTITSTGILANDVFRLVSSSIDNTPTLHQNQPIEKRYQASTTRNTAILVVAELANTINA